jgi:alkylation response protein AidB-like acyl-CoA dehydrogenase
VCLCKRAGRQYGKPIADLGGYGYTTDYPVERYFLDVRITKIYKWIHEIMRLVISANILI